ncbi:Hypothetical predicted protein [Mytilus galloprovincialis]|uniref:Uncharacterized protein n=1 Tax=Mytilus galloprovincialis TaxID=29158 RepID=A0A8B6ESM9_MYTGA|nr:Hypothetical predicted protein [Mytilus galloprovincialis]
MKFFSDSHISVKFDKEQIDKIIRNLQSHKASGIDEIPNEFLKFGGDALVDSLFAIITELEAVPDDWQNGIIKLLLKTGSAYDIDNYRGITLTSNVYKFWWNL